MKLVRLSYIGHPVKLRAKMHGMFKVPFALKGMGCPISEQKLECGQYHYWGGSRMGLSFTLGQDPDLCGENLSGFYSCDSLGEGQVYCGM